jgi:hypothetical protein
VCPQRLRLSRIDYWQLHRNTLLPDAEILYEHNRTAIAAKNIFLNMSNIEQQPILSQRRMNHDFLRFLSS